jgi:ribonuclease J
LLDFGISFSRYGQAFSEFLKPRKVNGMGDWLLSGVAPDLPGLYRQDYRGQNGMRGEARQVDAVLVSHSHLDHLGMVPLLRPDVTVASSPTAYAVARAIEETGGSFGESDFTRFREQFRFRPSKTRKKDPEGEGSGDSIVRVRYSDGGERGEEPAQRPWHRGDRLDLDGITAHLLPVDHSIHGARGILLEGEAQVAYSGDMRFHGRHRQWSERFVERCGGVDLLLIEGTNVHNEKKERPDGHLADFRALQDYSESGVESYLAEQLAKETGFVFVAYPQRDLDRMETFLRVARALGRRLCLTPKQAYLLDTVHAVASAALDAPVPATDDPDLRIYMPRKGWGLVERDDIWDSHRDQVEQDYAGWERAYLSHPGTLFRRDIAADPGRYMVFADVWNLTELHEFQPQGGAYVSSKTEPFSEEMELDRARLRWWLARWNLREVGAHVSGHARMEELVKMADDMGARKVVPIHTGAAAAYAHALGPRAVVPEVGKPIPLR